MDVQAELANAIKARHRKVYGIETPPPAPEKTKQKEKHTRQPVATNDIGKSSKNKAQKAAAAAIAAKMGKPAQSKPEKKEKKGWKASFSKKGSSGSATSSQSLSEKDKQTVEEYRKMLKRGLPEGAVMHKMQSNGFSKSIVDAVMSKDVAPAVVKQTQSSGSLSQEEEKIAEQYRKMKKMGLPDGAVTHKMIADGVSVKIQEAVLAGNSTSTARTTNISTSSSSRNSGTNTNAGGNVSSLSRQDEATATPYRKMIKTGLPEGAVRHKMTMDGVEKHIQDSVLKGETPAPPANDPSSGDTSSTRPVNPMAVAIASSGGIGFLKKSTPTETDFQPSKPSNPLAAAIAASGGMGALKKTSIQKQEVESGRPSNPLAAAIAASGGQGGLKKASVKNNQQSPKPRSSGNSLVDELAAKGFTSGLNSAKQPPKPKSANIAVSSKQKLVYVPPKPKSANIPVSSKQKTVYVPPKPKSTNVAVSSKQKPTVCVPLKSKPASITVSSKQIQAVYVPPKSKAASIAVSSKQNQAVCVPPKPKSANVAVQKPVPTPVGKPSKQKKVDTQFSPEMSYSVHKNKQPSAVTISRSEDNGNTQNKQRKKKVKNSGKNKKTSVNDEGEEQHCQCIVM